MAGRDSVHQIYLRSFQDSDGTDVSDYTDLSAEFGTPCDAVMPDGDRRRVLIARDRERGATLRAGRVRLRGHGVIVAEFDP